MNRQGAEQPSSEPFLDPGVLPGDDARYRAVVEDQTEVICRFKPDNTFTFANEAFCRFFGKTNQELMGHNWHPRAVAEDLPLIEAQLRALSPANPVVVVENRVHAANGEVRWMQFVNRAFFDGQGRLLETQSVGRDITERMQAVESLRRLNDTLEQKVAEQTAELRASAALLKTQYADLLQSEKRQRVVMETMLQGIVHQRADGTVVAMNPAAERILGRTREEFLGSSSVKEEHFTVREDGSPFPGMEHPAMVALRTGRPVRGVVMGVWNPRREEYRWIEIDAVPNFASGQNSPTEVYTMFGDVTERKHAEAALQDLQKQMDEMREHERQRLGRELHDGLSQLLTATKFRIGLLRRQLERQTPIDAAEVRGVEEEINHVLEQVRAMAHGLNPANLVAHGLMGALAKLAQSVSSAFKLDCVFEPPAPMAIEDQEVALHLYRIAQEAVQNAVHHGKARQIIIRLEAHSGTAWLEVEDNGVGFSPIAVPAGMGLANLQARAKAIGGQLEIRRRHGGGTIVTCAWPPQLTVAASAAPAI